MNIRIALTYQTPKGTITEFESDNMPIKQAIIIGEDIEKTGRVKEITFYDELGHQWTLKQMKKYAEEINTEPHQIIVYFDGGFDIQKNSAGLGCVIYYEQNDKNYRKRLNTSVEAVVSNNEAEYAALHLGIKELRLMDVKHLPVTFKGDSKVVINQLNDEWPCYEEELVKWMNRIEEELDDLDILATFQAISRHKNKEADRLATQALQGTQILSTVELK